MRSDGDGGGSLPGQQNPADPYQPSMAESYRTYLDTRTIGQTWENWAAAQAAINRQKASEQVRSGEDTSPSVTKTATTAPGE